MSTRLGDKSSHFENHQCGHDSCSTFCKMANCASSFSPDLPVFLSSSHSLSQFVSVSSSRPWSPLSFPLSIISSHDCLIPFCLLVFGSFYPSVLHCVLLLFVVVTTPITTVSSPTVFDLCPLSPRQQTDRWGWMAWMWRGLDRLTWSSHSPSRRERSQVT